MAREHSSVLQARADEAAESMDAADLALVKGRFESARDAWQGLADSAREHERDQEALAESKNPVEGGNSASD